MRQNTCSFEGCDRPAAVRFCRGHLDQLRRRGSAVLLTPIRIQNRQKNPCRCGKPGVLNSPWGWLCVAHHARWKKTGSPRWEEPVEFQRRKGTGMSRREIFLMNRYRITLAEYEAELASRGSGCALCGERERLWHRTLGIDHDHSCSHISFPRKQRSYRSKSPQRNSADLGCPDCIRGLLCGDCNQNLLPSIERGISLGLCVASEALRAYLAARPFRSGEAG